MDSLFPNKDNIYNCFKCKVFNIGYFNIDFRSSIITSGYNNFNPLKPVLDILLS